METFLIRLGQLNNSATSDPNVILERILKTSIEMLKDRGYTVNNDCRTLGDVKYKIQEGDPIFFGDKIGEDSDESVVVFYHNEDRVGVKHLRHWNEKYAQNKIIIVSLEGPTAFTKKEADHNHPNTQFFLFKSLCVNITRHELVPKHEKLGADQKNQMTRKVSSMEEWPKLYTNDVIAQYYDYKPGDLIRITRTIGYPEPIYYYRLVCNPIVV